MEISFAGHLPKRTRHVQMYAAHLLPRHSPENFGEHAHGVSASNDERSYAGPVASSKTNRDFPALAALIR